jgi:hypothetical protein
MPPTSTSQRPTGRPDERPARRRAGLAAALLLAATLQACVVVPREAAVYDASCQVYARQLVLSVEQVGVFGGCANEGCVALLVAAGAVTAVTAVISGTIVIAGNIVHWFERGNGCPPR